MFGTQKEFEVSNGSKVVAYTKAEAESLARMFDPQANVRGPSQVDSLKSIGTRAAVRNLRHFHA